MRESYERRVISEQRFIKHFWVLNKIKMYDKVTNVTDHQIRKIK